jgi:hypothetical protein
MKRVFLTFKRGILVFMMYLSIANLCQEAGRFCKNEGCLAEFSFRRNKTAVISL